MSDASIPEGTILDILKGEKSAIRFEDFCCDLLSVEVGVSFLPTSQSWDKGRDGRSLPLDSDGGHGFACCTIKDMIDDKHQSDLLRLKQSASPSQVFFCTTAKLSEHQLEKIRDEMETLLPDAKDCEPLGAIQIVKLAQHHPDCFRNRYRAELMERVDLIKSTDGDIGHIDGLRVALAIQFDDNAQDLRESLVRQLLLTVLSDKKPKSLKDLAKGASDGLRLPRIIHQECFRDQLSALQESGMINFSDGLYSISQSGIDELEERNRQSDQHLEKGRELIIRSLKDLLQYHIGDDSYAKLWKHLEDELSNLFYSHGLKIIQCISSLTNDGPCSATKKTFSELLEGTRKHIAALKIGGARSAAVAQAVIDLFTNSESDAFDWLTELAIKYVSICSLGLEPHAQQEIAGHLKDICLIVDTDIVLTYLSEGERPHKALKETLERWRDIGGEMRVIEPVLSETAHHAWISDNEYENVWRDLPAYSESEMPNYVENAFVRAFYYKGKGNYSQRRWRSYIREYRGASPTDTSLIKPILEEEGFEIKHDIAYDHKFAERVSREIYSIRGIPRGQYASPKTMDKIERDGICISHVRHCRNNSKRRETAVMISSSPTLLMASEKFGEEFGDPSPVWPIGALAYLVSLLPGVRLTLTSMKTALFGGGTQSSLSWLTNEAMRVIRRSNQYELGFSHRVTIDKELRKRIGRRAAMRGMRRSDYSDFIRSDSTDAIGEKAKLIHEAVDKIAESRAEKELRTLKNKPGRG